MQKRGWCELLARVLCIVILVLEFRGLSMSLPRSKWKTFVFYTQLSNLVTAISAGCLVILGQLPWITGLEISEHMYVDHDISCYHLRSDSDGRESADAALVR